MLETTSKEEQDITAKALEYNKNIILVQLINQKNLKHHIIVILLQKNYVNKLMMKMVENFL